MIFSRPLSIIIPVYNTEEFLGPCLDSILEGAQGEYEIIIIDDGSTDKSLSVAKYYDSIHEHIKVISQANKGVSAARNAGMLAARGDYIWFVDSDDLIAHNSLAVVLRELKKNPDILSFNMKRFRRDSQAKSVARDVPSNATFLVDATDLLTKKGFNPSLCCNIFRVAIAKGYQLDTTLINNEDIDFTLNNILSASRVLYLHEHLYLYRQRDSSATSRYTLRRIDDSQRVIGKYIGVAGALDTKASQDLLSYLSYLYIVMLGSFSLVSESSTGAYDKIKEQSALLGYGKGSLFLIANLVHKVLGLQLLSGVLGQTIRLKRHFRK